jgi:hypothetical protein
MNISQEECQSKHDPATCAETSIDVAEMPSPIKKNRKGQVRIFKFFLSIEFRFINLFLVFYS